MRIPQNTFQMLQSTAQIESIRFSTQTISRTSSNVVETFVQLAFLEAIKIRIHLPVQNNVVHKFLRISQITFQMLQSTAQMESSRSSTQTITTTFSNVLQTFVQLGFIEDIKIMIDFLV